MSKLQQWRRRVHYVLNPTEHQDDGYFWIDYVILGVIVINVAALVLETVASIGGPYAGLFYAIETVSVAIFTVEYLVRLWAARADPRYQAPVTGRLRYAVRPMMVVDLLAILPFYLAFITADLRVLRAARLARVVRVAKLARYSETLQSFGRVLRRSKEELVTVMGLLVFLLLVASTLLYFTEHEAQPEEFSSIPAAMWWAIITLTTVGYGDIFPVTAVGRLFAGVIAVLGIGMFALPAGILGSAFVEEIGRKKETEPHRCPHCGKDMR